MEVPIEEIILKEVEKDRSNNLDTRIDYFHQICSRLGLKQEGINEFVPKLREILKEIDNTGSYH